MDQQGELSVADFFAFGNAAATHTAELERQRSDAAPREDVEPDEA